MAGEVEREGEAGERRDRKGREHTSACGRTHTKQWVKTITEGHYQMRFVKLPGISTPLHHPPTTIPVPVHFILLFLALFLHSNDKSWWVVPAWDGQRRAILLAINFRL